MNETSKGAVSHMEDFLSIRFRFEPGSELFGRSWPKPNLNLNPEFRFGSSAAEVWFSLVQTPIFPNLNLNQVRTSSYISWTAVQFRLHNQFELTWTTKKISNPLQHEFWTGLFGKFQVCLNWNPNLGSNWGLYKPNWGSVQFGSQFKLISKLNFGSTISSVQIT